MSNRSSNTRSFIYRLLSAFYIRDVDIDSFTAPFHLDGLQSALIKKFASEKVRHFKTLAAYDYQIVSLGTNCLPCTVPTRWGLKPTRAMGEVRMPFDLAVHPIATVRDLFANDFTNYTGELDAEVDYFVNKKYDIVFNHDRLPRAHSKTAGSFDVDCILNDFSKTLRARAENIKLALQNGNCIGLIVISSGGRKYMSMQEELLADIRKHLRRFSSTNLLVSAVICKDESDIVPEDGIDHCFKYVLPYAEYVWHEPEHYFSENGFRLEQSFSEFLAAIVMENMPLREVVPYDDSVFSLYTKSSSLSYFRSHAYCFEGNYKEAIGEIQHAIAIKDDNPHFYSHLGNLLRNVGDLDGTREALEKAIALDPSIPAPHMQLSHMFNQLGDLKLAIQKVRDALAIKDDNPYFYVHLGSLLRNTGDLDGAKEAQEKAIALDPSSPAPHMQLSYIFDQLGDSKLAIQKVQDALAIKDDDPHYYFHLGSLLRNTGDLDGAKEAQEKAIALDPSSPAPHMQLSYIFNQLGDLKLAIQKVQDALAIKDDNPHFYSHLGNLLRKTGDLDGAKEAQEKAIALDPSMS